MLKKIPLDELRPGMFVADLGRGWLCRPFLRSRFLLHDREDIRRIGEAGVREVLIDTGLGCDREEGIPPEGPEAQLASAEAIELPGEAPRRVPVEEERARALAIYSEGMTVVRRLMTEARLSAHEVQSAERVVQAMTDSILRNRDALLSLHRLRSADTYTFHHSLSVCALTIAFCHALGEPAEAIREAGLGALLHDIGKIRIPAETLRKPGPLSAAELESVRRHPADGQDILREQTRLGPAVLVIAAQHHERSDGSGYPQGREGEHIDRYARMVAIADVYDAITSDRCYHRKIAPTDALRNLLQWSRAGQFDQRLTSAFIRCVGIYPAGELVRLSSCRLAIVLEQNAASSLRPRVRVLYDIRRRQPVAPVDIDLGQGVDEVLSHEDPARWGIALPTFP